MAFWKENNIVPKRKFRFQVQFGRGTATEGVTASKIYWWAKTIKIPTFTVAPIEHHYLDNKYNFPGRVTWEDVDMTLVDPSDPDAVAIMMTLLEESGYYVKGKDITEPRTVNKVDAAQLTCVINVLDEEGETIEKWTLKNCFMLSVNLGDYSYQDDELRELSMTLKYDWAECEITPSAENANTRAGSADGNSTVASTFDHNQE